mmetsp:Transcript_8034/g.14751  ORF Transcript_8034/g.14751 Transcript_8034/m.14751 type:complete len:351 (+) Transcript_8034:95-1147(+)
MATPISSSALAGHAEHSTQGLFVSVPLLIFGMVMFMMEQKRRNAGDNAAGLLVTQVQPASTLCGTLFSLVPECAGILLVALCAWVELNAGEDHSALKHDDEESREIKHDWPVLKSADSLLGIQAMLRLIFLVSALLRRSDAAKSPLAGLAASFFFLAALCRVALGAISPADLYNLDGPLGQRNMAIEVAALPLLAVLSAATMRRGLGATLALALGALATATIAFFNRFELAGDEFHLDVLFSLVQLLELAAGVSFSLRSIMTGGLFGSEDDAVSSGSIFSDFAHVFLPLQQSLSMYYFLCAFAPPFTVEPTLVGKGHPFEVLQLAGLAQVGIYLFAGVCHFSALDKQADS